MQLTVKQLAELIGSHMPAGYAHGAMRLLCLLGYALECTEHHQGRNENVYDVADELLSHLTHRCMKLDAYKNETPIDTNRISCFEKVKLIRDAKSPKSYREINRFGKRRVSIIVNSLHAAGVPVAHIARALDTVDTVVEHIVANHRQVVEPVERVPQKTSSRISSATLDTWTYKLLPYRMAFTTQASQLKLLALCEDATVFLKLLDRLKLKYES